jgi:hypothetical protein
MKKLVLLLLMAGAELLGITNASAQQSPVAINVSHTNTTSKAIFVNGLCSATSTAKDLEGWVGQTAASTLYASFSGTARQAITVVVPPSWQYQITVTVPTGGVCNAWSTVQ